MEAGVCPRRFRVTSVVGGGTLDRQSLTHWDGPPFTRIFTHLNKWEHLHWCLMYFLRYLISKKWEDLTSTWATLLKMRKTKGVMRVHLKAPWGNVAGNIHRSSRLFPHLFLNVGMLMSKRSLSIVSLSGTVQHKAHKIWWKIKVSEWASCLCGGRTDAEYVHPFK